MQEDSLGVDIYLWRGEFRVVHLGCQERVIGRPENVENGEELRNFVAGLLDWEGVRRWEVAQNCTALSELHLPSIQI